MKCFNHEDNHSVYICKECQKALCQVCMEEEKANIYCEDCIKKIRKKALKPAENVNVNYNRFWGFIFSLIPGAGQMYLGIMNRGLQLMFAFLLGIFYVVEFNFGRGIFAALVGVVWFYSFFDYLFIKRKINNGDIIFDEHIYPIKTKKVEIKYLGIGLVVLGMWLFITAILGYVEISYEARRLVYDMFIPLLMIGAGVVLLMKNKKKKTDAKEE
ncbi:MAG: hypothetical protein MJA31_19515, partial [Clostridia bacterium]|nr:hypothetical protein [Clostridia bacterium]